MPRDIDSFEIRSLIFVSQVFSPAQVIFAGVGVLLSVRNLFQTFLRAIETPPIRRLWTFKQARIL
jgi:hypothetical protein